MEKETISSSSHRKQMVQQQFCMPCGPDLDLIPSLHQGKEPELHLEILFPIIKTETVRPKFRYKHESQPELEIICFTHFCAELKI